MDFIQILTLLPFSPVCENMCVWWTYQLYTYEFLALFFLSGKTQSFLSVPLMFIPLCFPLVPTRPTKTMSIVEILGNVHPSVLLACHCAGALLKREKALKDQLFPILKTWKRIFKVMCIYSLCSLCHVLWDCCFFSSLTVYISHKYCFCEFFSSL